MLLEEGDVLRGAAVEDVEGGRREVVDGVAVAVGDGDVGEDKAGVGVEGVGGLIRGGRSVRRGRGLGARDRSREKHTGEGGGWKQ